MARTSRTNRNTSLSASCNLSAGRAIRKETLRQKEKPVSQRRPRKQVIRIGFEKTRKKRPECKEILRR